MTEKKGETETTGAVDRREFLTTTAVVGGGMVLGFWLPPGLAAATDTDQPWYRDALGWTSPSTRDSVSSTP